MTACMSRVKHKSGETCCPHLVGGCLYTKDLKLRKKEESTEGDGYIYLARAALGGLIQVR